MSKRKILVENFDFSKESKTEKITEGIGVEKETLHAVEGDINKSWNKHDTITGFMKELDEQYTKAEVIIGLVGVVMTMEHRSNPMAALAQMLKG